MRALMTLEQCSCSHTRSKLCPVAATKSEIITGLSPRSNLLGIQTDMDPAGREGAASPHHAKICLWVEFIGHQNWTLSLYPSPSGSPALAQTEVLACVSQCYKNAKTCGYVIWVVPEDRASRGILGGASHFQTSQSSINRRRAALGPSSTPRRCFVSALSDRSVRRTCKMKAIFQSDIMPYYNIL